MRSPHRREGTEAVDGLRVADEADADHRRALDDGDGLRGLLLVELRPRLIHVAHDVRHAGLVAHEGRQVAPEHAILRSPTMLTGDPSSVICRAFERIKLCQKVGQNLKYILQIVD